MSDIRVGAGNSVAKLSVEIKKEKKPPCHPYGSYSFSCMSIWKLSEHSESPR